MIKRVEDFCRQMDLLHEGDRVIIGLSGGADSVCLFLALEALRKPWNLTLYPVHVNHNLRGEEADADQRFCEELCRQYGLELKVASLQVAELARENGWTLEEAGRNARYRVFEEYKEETGSTVIAVAHHKNDQAETVLFQLLRGSRLKGLAGMEARRGDIIRPLLCVTRKEIEEYLAKDAQSYCIDRTNEEEDYTRNKIRHGLLPVASRIQPKAVEHLAETAEYLGRVERFLESLEEELYRETVTEEADCVKLSVPELKQAEPLLAERVVYRALVRVAGQKKDITSLCVMQCMELWEKQTGRELCLPVGLRAVREYDTLRICKRMAPVEPEPVFIEKFPASVYLGDELGELQLEIMELPQDLPGKISGIPKSNYTKWFDYDTINSDISLKTVQSQDRMILYADGRGKKVWDVLADARIPKEERGRRLVLAAGEEVLWIPGVRGSEGHRVTETTKRVLVATIDGGKRNGRQD